MVGSRLDRLRVGVVGAGAFGTNHLRNLGEMAQVELAGVVETDPNRAQQAAATYGCPVYRTLSELIPQVDAAVVATPTATHADLGIQLLEAGLDILVEKPIASDLASAQRLSSVAEKTGRILLVGHLERFNPVIHALAQTVRLPLFFEIHRMSLFSARSLDVDVVLDLMIHDIDIVLALVGEMPSEIRAAGISILSSRVDIANVRLAFPGGCVANLTASRVSTEKIRKIRLFQPHQYFSVDYHKQDGAVFTVSEGPDINLGSLPVEKGEPLRLELEHFADCCLRRQSPLVGGVEALRALQVALAIQEKMDEHSNLVAKSVQRQAATPVH